MGLGTSGLDNKNKENRMKKLVLLSAVASTIIMAGGDVAPAPVAVEAPAWTFNGQAAIYYQTRSDLKGSPIGINLNPTEIEDIFSQENSAANVGLSLKAENKNIIGGFGAGAKLIGLGTLNLEEDVVDGIIASADGVTNDAGDIDLNGAAITELFLTYGIGNTAVIAGRQELPPELSPLAFSETWNVFPNTFEAAVIVNTDLPSTTLVGAYVAGSNNFNDLSEFDDMSAARGLARADEGAYMVTAQNKSIEKLTLTGSFYYIPDVSVAALGETEDVTALWLDANYGLDAVYTGLTLGLQGGIISTSDFSVDAANAALGTTYADETTAFGAKIGGKFAVADSKLDASLVYTSVDDGLAPVENIGTNIKTPLYTQMIFNQNFIKSDADTFMLRAGADIAAIYGRIGVDAGFTDKGNMNVAGPGDYTEVDVIYTTKIDAVKLFAAYIYSDNTNDANSAKDFEDNAIRVWARYNF